MNSREMLQLRHEKLESKGNVVIEIIETAQMGCRYATPHFSNSLPTNSTIGASKSTIRTVITPTSPPVRNPSIVAIRSIERRTGLKQFRPVFCRIFSVTAKGTAYVCPDPAEEISRVAHHNHISDRSGTDQPPIK